MLEPLDPALDALAQAIRRVDPVAWRPLVEAIRDTPPERAGFSDASCAALTRALVDSTSPGCRLENWPFPVIDMATTGGVGLKSSIVVSTWLAYLGHHVPKIASGGASGAGTIDTLQALGLRVDQAPALFAAQVGSMRLAFADQTGFAPADQQLMTLRRELGAMDRVPLVISSILAKKMALGLKRFAVEVRCGVDSNTGDHAGSREAARRFVTVGQALGLEVLAVVTNSDLLGAHGFGAPLLASECLRHLAWAFADGDLVGPGHEHGLLWDRSHRQALDLLALVDWWATGTGEAPTRAWLRGRVAQLGGRLREQRAGVLAFFLRVAAAQGSPFRWDGGDVSALKAELMRPHGDPIDVPSPGPLLPDLSAPALKAVWKAIAADAAGLELVWRLPGPGQVRAFPRPGTNPARLAEALAEALGRAGPGTSRGSELPPTAILGAWYRGVEGPRALDLSENVLLATLGTTAGVLTETVDAYATGPTPLLVDRLVVLHTRNPKSQEQLDAVRRDLRLRSAEELRAKASDPGAGAGENLPVHLRLAVTSLPLSGEDVVDEAGSNEVFRLMRHALHVEREHGHVWGRQPRLLVSIAGGRKTMSALAYFAAMQFPDVEVSHVLVAQEDPRIFHVPPRDLLLIRPPAFSIGELVDYVQRELKQQSGRSLPDWDELRAAVDGLLQRSMMRDLVEAREREAALAELVGASQDPLLGALHLAVVRDPDHDLAQVLTEALPGVALKMNSFDVLPEAWATYDAIILGEPGLRDPNLLRRALHSPVPVLSITTKSGETLALTRYLHQHAVAFWWVDRSDPGRLAHRLASLLGDFSAPRQLPHGLEVRYQAEEPERAVLGRLFTGRAEHRIEVAGEASGGVSGARKIWVHGDGKPRRYFVKLAPFEDCFAEYAAFRAHVHGAADNYSGRIEWPPARAATMGAVAYTEVGASEHLLLLAEALTNDVEQGGRVLRGLVLQAVRTFHAAETPRTETIHDDLVRSMLNRLLPADGDHEYGDGTGAADLAGHLMEAPARGKLQILDARGRKLNVLFPEAQRRWLTSPRLHIGRPLKFRATLRSSLPDLVRKAVAEVFPEDAPAALRELCTAVQAARIGWESELGRQISIGVIHGELNLQNVLVEYTDARLDEPRGAWLIDFACTRRGPVLFDYAKLEVELFTQVLSRVLPRVPAWQAPDPWDTARLGSLIEGLYRPADLPAQHELAAFANCLRDVGEAAAQHAHGAPSVYRRMRGIYALNTFKFGNLDHKGVLPPDRKYLGRRLGLLLAARFLVGS
jgi:CRISPR-associated protein (TIGR02584 family)